MSGVTNLILLDGAMGTELRRRGVRVPDYRSSAWSALALLAAPGEVLQLHRDYIRSGADVITANNYAVTPHSLGTEGLSDRTVELTVLACRLACSARAAETAKVRVAGSLPPLNISYRADLVGPFDDLVAQYRELAGAMSRHVDLFICETMSTTREARAAASAALELGKPVWLSFTLKDDGGCLRGGQSVCEAAKDLQDLELDAVLFNCSSVRAVDRGLEEIHAFRNCALGVYANPFRQDPPEDYDLDGRPNRIAAPDYAKIAVRQWVGRGVTIVGGCCGTGPSYTKALRKTLFAHRAIDPSKEKARHEPP